MPRFIFLFLLTSIAMCIQSVDAASNTLVVDQTQEGRVTVTSAAYRIEHDTSRGGVIDRITFIASGKVVNVVTDDGLKLGGQSFSLNQDDAPQITVRQQGDTAVIEVIARYRNPDVPRDQCPAVTYTYTYHADSSLIHIGVMLPRQDIERDFNNLAHHALSFPEEGAFDTVQRLINAGDSGAVMPLSAPFTACEDRPNAGVLCISGNDALALISPLLGRASMDTGAHHIKVRSFLDAWNGREITSGATLYIGAASDIDETLQTIAHSYATTPVSHVPGWRAQFKRIADGVMISTGSRDAAPTIATQGNRQTYTWICLTVGPSQINVVMTRRDGDKADGDLSRWSIDVKPTDDKIGLWELEFPVMAGIHADPTDPATDYLMFPYKSGVSMPNPVMAGLCQSYYPGSAASPFMAYWQGDRGLYIGAHDPGAAVKIMSSLPTGDGTLELSITHPTPGRGLPGAGFTIDYDVVIGPFTGDWYDAVQIYRKWMLKQSWFPRKPLAERDDLPRWYTDLVVALRRAGGPDGSVESAKIAYGERFKYAWGVLDEYETLGEPDAIMWWYHSWGHPNDREDRFHNAPDLLPMPGFREGVSRLKSRGIHTIAYLIHSIWDQRAESWKTENADDAVLIKSDGSPWRNVWNKPLAIMCPASPIYQKKIRQLFHDLASSADVDGAYFDLSGVGNPFDCYATNHGHPIGSGAWMTEGKIKLLHDAREEARKVNPDFILITEGTADAWAGTVDGFAMFESNLPVTQALYADYHRTAGAKRNSLDDAPFEALNVAKHFVRGEVIGRFNGNEMRVKDFELDADKVAYYNHIIDHKTVARPWLNYGQMLRPTPVTNISPPGPLEVSHDTLLPHATWRAPDGTVAFVFANARRSTDVSFHFTADPAIYDIPADSSWTLDSLEAEDEQRIAKWTQLAMITGPIARDVKLPAGGTLILVARPTGKVE